MSVSERMDEVVLAVKKLRSESLPHPSIWQDLDPDPDVQAPSHIQELAMRSAAQREYMGSLLSQARKQMALCEVVLAGSEHDFQTALDEAMAEAAGGWIARGYAWPERQAKANLSVLERKVEHRGVEMKAAQVRSLVAEIDDCYRAWRDTEWSIDRVVRMLALRHSMGEV